MKNHLKKGFTLVEMLIVIGIIAIISAATIMGFSKATRTAQRAKAQEIVSNAATALTYILQKQGTWPKILADQPQGKLNATIAQVFVAAGDDDPNDKKDPKDPYTAKKALMGLSYNIKTYRSSRTIELTGVDRCGVVTPWAAAVLKRPGTTEGSKVPSGGKVSDHILYYAIDEDGDGIVNISSGNVSMEIRATAAVWCAGANGTLDGFTVGTDDVFSWNAKQRK